MSQNSPIGFIDESGSAHLSRHNDVGDSLLSQHKGASRPAYAVAGLKWIKDSVSPNEVYYYDGADDILLGRIDTTNNRVFQEEFGATLASATTVSVYGAAAKFIEITGTTTIAAFDTAPVGTVIFTRFASSLTLTHNVTSFILLNSIDVVVVAGETVVWKSLGSGNWRMIARFVSDGFSSSESQASIAAATTTNILGSSSSSILLTGGSPITITSFGTSIRAGIKKHVTSTGTGAHVLTHNATSLILPNNTANITVAQGDSWWVEDLGSNNCRVSGYTRAAGTAALATIGLAAENVLQSDQAVTTVASASSVALATTTEQYITGTTAITEFTGTAGVKYHCRTAAALPLTHSADLNVLQTGANVTLDAGATFDVYMVDANSSIISNIQLASGKAIVAAAGIILGTPVASTSGTAIDFTSIPVTTKRLTVGLSGVSTSGTSHLIVQIGDSGGIETSGYTGTTTGATTGTIATNWSSGAIINSGVTAVDIGHAQIIMTLMDSSTNTWVISVVVGGSDVGWARFGAGTKSLSAILDRVRITTAGGSDTFDAGKINVMYEG